MEETEDARPRATLGDVLCADKTAAPVSETDWIRLVHAIASGDHGALHALYERTNRIVFTLCMRATGSREIAEELTLDVFHDVWRRASAYDPASGSVVGWIMNQTRSRMIDRLRLEQRNKRVLPDSLVPEEKPVQNGPHETFQLEEQGNLLRHALGALVPHERAAIEMAFFSELTHAGVAARLNESRGTVKTRMRSGLRKLREALAEKL